MKTEEAFWLRISRGGDDECWPWLGSVTSDGYGRTWFIDRPWLAHRLAWRFVNGEIPETTITVHGTVIRHSCDNPVCCNPQHLVAGTQLDNIADRHNRSRNGDHKGEAHGKSKITAVDVLAIRASSESHAALGRKYGMTKTGIWQIRHYKNWKHVP